jgi:hypothetical protein
MWTLLAHRNYLRCRGVLVGSAAMRKTATLGLGIWRFSCGAVIGTALGFSSLDISRNGPNGDADWHASLVSPAHAEQEYAILVMQIVRNLLNIGADSNQRNQLTPSGGAGGPNHLGMYVGYPPETNTAWGCMAADL